MTTLHSGKDLGLVHFNRELELLESSTSTIGRLYSEVFISETLMGEKLESWIRNFEANFKKNEDSEKSHSSTPQIQPVPNLRFVESMHDMIARLKWLVIFEESVGNDHGLTRSNAYYLDLWTSAINEALPLIMNRAFQISDSFNSFAQNSTFDRDIMILLLVSGLVLGLCYFFEILSLWKLQRFLNSAVEAYSLLKRSDLASELDKLEYCRNYYEKGNQFEEKERMSQALVIFVKAIGKEKAKYYKGLNSIQREVSNNGQDNQEAIGKKSLMLSRNKTNRMAAKRLFKGVFWSLIYGTLLIALVFLCSGLVIMVNNMVKANTDIKNITIKTTSHFLKAQLGFSALMIFNPYAISGLKSGWQDAANLIGNYRKDKQVLIGYLNSERQNLRILLGHNNTIEKIVYGDLCKEVATINRIETEWTICTDLDKRIATQGFLAYSVYEDRQVEDLVNGLDTILKISTRLEPPLIDPLQQASLSQLFYDPHFLELQFQRSEIFSKTLNTIIMYSQDMTSSKDETIFSVIGWMRMVGLALVCLPFAVMIIKTGRLITTDSQVSFYTFELLSPDIVINNQYLLAKFKDYFKTTSY